MKKAIALLCACILLPGAVGITSYAASTDASANVALLAESIEVAKMQHSLINDKENYELYSASVYAESNDGELDPSRTYRVYYVAERENNKPGGYFYGNTECDIRSGLTSGYPRVYNGEEISEEYRDEYYFRHYHFPFVGGHISIYHPSLLSRDVNVSGGAEAIPMDARSLFFDTKLLAELLYGNGIERVTDMRLFNNDYMSGDRSVLSEWMIYIEDQYGEYVISDARYSDGKLSSYDLLDRNAFIAAMNGDNTQARELGYSRLQMLTPPGFYDVSGDRAVSLLSRLGIIDGYGDGSFDPNSYITRAEAARMLAALTVPKSYNINLLGGNYENVLSDVDERHWAYNYIEYGYISGYIEGKEKTGSRKSKRDNVLVYVTDENGYHPIIGETKIIDTYAFHPEDNVTEQEMAKMIVTAIEPFSRRMATAEGGWPDGYVSVARRLGICDGASDAPATRLTAAHMIKNALDAEVNTRSSYWLIDNWRVDAKVWGDEKIYDHKAFYFNDASAKRVRLTGRITGVVRENELSFISTEEPDMLFGASPELTILTRYSDIKDFIGRECTVYCELQYGSIVAIMAE